MVLLAGSALLLRSFARLRSVDPGFRTEKALAFRVSLPDSAYAEDARRLSFHDELQRRLEALPGVRSAGAVAGLPLGGSRFSISFTVAGRPEVPPAQQSTSSFPPSCGRLWDDEKGRRSCSRRGFTFSCRDSPS